MYFTTPGWNCVLSIGRSPCTQDLTASVVYFKGVTPAPAEDSILYMWASLIELSGLLEKIEDMKLEGGKVLENGDRYDQNMFCLRIEK